MAHDQAQLATKEWSVQIFISEQDGTTRAHARLHTGDRTSLEGTGEAHRSAADRDVPEIGDELAVARALAALARQLLETADDDVEAAVSEDHR